MVSAKSFDEAALSSRSNGKRVMVLSAEESGMALST
jgi:hypothetical protein